MSGCASGNGSDTEQDSVSVVAENPNNKIVDNFFTQFQQENPDWTETKAGHNKLKQEFEKKMTGDLEFAKAVTQYTDDYMLSSISRQESISPYSKADGRKGEIKAFEISIPVALAQPLYNGEKEVRVSCEIISTIPSTIEDHSRPYTDGVNHCATFSPYFKTYNNGVLSLGTFIITEKD